MYYFILYCCCKQNYFNLGRKEEKKQILPKSEKTNPFYNSDGKQISKSEVIRDNMEKSRRSWLRHPLLKTPESIFSQLSRQLKANPIKQWFNVLCKVMTIPIHQFRYPYFRHRYPNRCFQILSFRHLQFLLYFIRSVQTYLRQTHHLILEPWLFTGVS